jgi:hypothetical protein
MKRQSSSESNKKSSRQSSQDCDSEASDVAEQISRPSNLSSYAEYTESDGDEDVVNSDVDGNRQNIKNEVRIFYQVLTKIKIILFFTAT